LNKFQDTPNAYVLDEKITELSRKIKECDKEGGRRRRRRRRN